MEKSIKILISFIFLVGIIGLNSVNAVPQIITSYTNVSIYSNQSGNNSLGTFNMFGEGGQLSQTFSIQGSCNFSYNLNNIPLIFSREIQQNETDVAILIRALAVNNNMSQQWQECNHNLSICMNDVGYKGNYTVCSNQLDICHDFTQTSSTENTNLKEEVKKWKNYAFIGLGIGALCAFAAWNYRKKALVRTIKTPVSSLPGNMRI